MRVLLVAAHYPPNFVSGGSLQPHALARRLLLRGHDVRVYAGWIGEREPLETFSSEHEGVPVRWIVTTPFMARHDDRNWDNPAVAADFADHLDEVRPDLVHFHSLQMLGAGLVVEAQRRSIPEVVTMHDLWWVCPRMFLVDRQLRPCCVVVDAGDCQCEAGRRWLDDRNERLRRVMEGVDRVLSPSATAARVLAANGVDPDRLVVDENGVDVEVRPAPAGPEGGPVRFVYVGGPNPMKGPQVLARAVARLDGRPGWLLTAYGFDEPHELGDSSSAVTLQPSFDPDERDEVFGNADVLVVPSLARESYSLVTREALLRGVPVICTDTFGPEEVVREGVNGFVVRAGSPDELAEAMGKVLAAPELLRHLRREAPSVVVRTIEEQVSGLEELYAETVERGAEAGAGPTDIRRVLFVAGIDGAPLRYRVRLPMEALSLIGVSTELRWYRDPDLTEEAGKADAVVFYRVPATPDLLELIARLRGQGVPTFFDVDDLIFEPDVAAEISALRVLPADEAELWLEGVRRYRTTLEACDTFVGSTAALVERTATLTGKPAERFENGVGRLIGRASDIALGRRRTRGPLRIGYFSGTDTHDQDWRYIEPAVVEVLDRHPDVELWLGGSVPRTGALSRFADRLRRFDFQPWQELQDVLRDLDVNLAPLQPGEGFNEAKSAIKWLEAALVETPTVASPTEPFRAAIDDGRTGFLAADLTAWSSQIGALLTDDQLRATMGRRARREALLRWSPHLQGRRYLALLERHRQPSPDRPGSSWDPVTRDEPPEPTAHAFDPYQLRVPPGWAFRQRKTVLSAMAQRGRARLQPWIDRARVLVRDEGVTGVVRGAGRQLRKRLR